MDEIFSILDDIKKKYIQIDLDKYERIKNLLELIWEKFKQISEVNGIPEENYNEQINNLLDFYNPKKNPATRIKIIENLPSKAKLLEEDIINEEEVEELHKNNIIYIIKRTDNDYLLLTPEGLIFYFALVNSKNYDDIYRLNTLLIQNYEKYLLNNLRNFIFKKFDLFHTKREGVNLNFKDIGILLFFLVNGSIDKQKAFTREDLRSERAINCVVQAFYKNKEFNEEKRSKIRIRVLQSDVSLLDSKLGYVIHNKKSTYFLRSKDLPLLLNILKENIRSQKKEEIISRWNSFLKEYDYWRPLLRQNNICFYDRFEVKKIEEEILNIKN